MYFLVMKTDASEHPTHDPTEWALAIDNNELSSQDYIAGDTGTTVVVTLTSRVVCAVNNNSLLFLYQYLIKMKDISELY